MEIIKRKKLIVKIGAGCWRFDEGTGYPLFKNLADQFVELKENGYDIVGFVVSGAVLVGKTIFDCELGASIDYQRCAGVGQHRLMKVYQEMFSRDSKLDYKIYISQYLITYRDIEFGKEDIKEGIEEDLKKGIIPLINYNDKVDWKFTEKGEILKDNDRFSAKIAELMGCKMLVILTGDVDGLLDENKKLIKEVKGEKIEKYMKLCNGVGSGTVGGFKTKLEAGKIMFDNGGVCFIANSKNTILNIVKGSADCTLIK